MTRKAALEELKHFSRHYCVVRWFYRPGVRPEWTVETLRVAEKQIKELGPEAVRIEAIGKKDDQWSGTLEGAQALWREKLARDGAS